MSYGKWKKEVPKRRTCVTVKQSSVKQSERRIDEIFTAFEALKNHPIEYDNQAVRQIIECIKAIAAEQILIVLKGGPKRTVQFTAE